MDARELQVRLVEAVRMVANNQPELWTLKAGERAIAGQVFLALDQMTWPRRFAVDTEWQREGRDGGFKGQDPDLAVTPNKHGADSARPDVIIHVRGESGRANNLLIAEFKLGPLDSVEASSDLTKVRRVMTRFGYVSGAVVSFGRELAPRNLAGYWLTSANAEPEHITFGD